MPREPGVPSHRPRGPGTGTCQAGPAHVFHGAPLPSLRAPTLRASVRPRISLRAGRTRGGGWGDVAIGFGGASPDISPPNDAFSLPCVAKTTMLALT